MSVRQKGRGTQDRTPRDADDGLRRPSMYRRGRGMSRTLTVLDVSQDYVKSIRSHSRSPTSLRSPSSENGAYFEDDFLPAQSDGERRRAPTTQWTMMDGVVRKADKGKVTNCKEDIDTLLVFAGLFSAVLTAFVIESYHNLQPDTLAETVTLLRQISLQLSSYSISSVFANATHSMTFAMPPPMGSAVLVNALWFASLIVSLITASLAMLVKQWLHEYLAGDYYSPTARLRIRQFRHDGIQDWYVFEIAAVLPLLLQVSLGLFFLGLVNFTFSVNTKVGWTTGPLVVAWLLLLLLTIVAPIFSPRCPYKVTFLVGAFKVLRKWIGRLIQLLRRGPASDATQSDSESTLSDTAEYKSGWFEEEADAVTSPRSDLRIFLAVDAMLASDHLVDGFYREHIKSLRSTGPDVVNFVLTVMGRRTRQRDRVSRTKLPLASLRPLSKTVWIGLTGILADAMEEAIVRDMLQDEGRRAFEWVLQDWMKDVLMIVMSDSGYTFQQSEANIITHALLYDRNTATQLLRLSKRNISPHDFTDVVDLARETLKAFDADRVIACMLALGQWAVSQYSESLCDVLRSRRLGMKGVMAVVRVLVDKLTQELDWRHEYRGSPVWDVWLDDALRCVIPAYARFEVMPEDRDLRADVDDIAGVVWRLCAEDPETMAAVFRHLPDHDSTSDEAQCPCLFAAAIGHDCITSDERAKIVQNFEVLVKGAVELSPDSKLRSTLIDIAGCLRNHKISYASESSRWRTFYSLLLPSNHETDETGVTAVGSPPLLDGHTRVSDQEPSKEYVETQGKVTDLLASTPMHQPLEPSRPFCRSPGPMAPGNISGDSEGTVVNQSTSALHRPHAKTFNEGTVWHAGYGSPISGSSETSPDERGYGEKARIPPVQSTPTKQQRGRPRFRSPLRQPLPLLWPRRGRSLDSLRPKVSL